MFLTDFNGGQFAKNTLVRLLRNTLVNLAGLRWSVSQDSTVGNRIKLKYTRQLIKSAMDGTLENVEYEQDPIFGFNIPKECPEIPSDILNPKNSWSDSSVFENQSIALASKFIKNFEPYASEASAEILNAAPNIYKFV